MIILSSIATRAVLLSIIIAITIAAVSTRTSNDLVVTTKAGKIKGVSRVSGGAEFLGIPYAQPPIGDLRWHEPVPTTPWTGVREAATFGAPCSQSILGDWNRHDSETSKEDCLFLNVITPTWPATTRLPVMFWIHGGANAGGTASSALYKDGTLVNHGVVLVTINYRLSILGFFAHPGLTRESAHHASGNYGLMDQIAALQWVHDNIAQFGGDPNNVTVFGQSAGAQDTSLLMTSPLARGLFHRVIVQSGSGINPPATLLADSEKAGEKLARLLNAPADGDAIKYLRGLSPTELLKPVANQNPTQLPLIGPNVDGWALTRSPDKVFAEQQQAAVPMIIGTTTREFGFSAPIDQLRSFIKNVTGNLSERAFKVYGLADKGQGTTDPVYGPVGDQWFADLVFRCPVVIQSSWHSKLNPATYEYELAHAIPGQESQGAVHSADLPYVFGFYPRSGNIAGQFNEVDFRLANLIETYWSNFAKTGNPNGDGVPNWPAFGSTQNHIRFTQSGEVVESRGLRREQCDLFSDVLKQRLN